MRAAIRLAAEPPVPEPEPFMAGDQGSVSLPTDALDLMTATIALGGSPEPHQGGIDPNRDHVTATAAIEADQCWRHRFGVDAAVVAVN